MLYGLALKRWNDNRNGRQVKENSAMLNNVSPILQP